MMWTTRGAALALGLLALSPAGAQTEVSPGMQTGWLELVKGHVGDAVGAEVHDVQEDADSGHRQVLVAIPKGSVTDHREIEEVRVIGRAPDRMEIDLPELETEWVDDYDNDYYGLLIRLKDGPKTPFRLYLSAGAGILDNSVPVQP